MGDVQTPWTVRSLLAWGRDWLSRRGVDNPRLDAELLVAHALGCDRVRLYTEFDKPLAAEELSRARPLFERRGQREPVAYILGVKEFYGRPFKVGPGVFIPRPETELLVQVALEGLPQGPVQVLDLCAGSGAVGVTVAAERPEAQVDVVDIADPAVAAARENAEVHARGRVTVLRGDLYGALAAHRRYDAVLANNSFLTATNLTLAIDPVAGTSLQTGLDITTTSDLDYYTFAAPLSTTGTLQVKVPLKTSGPRGAVVVVEEAPQWLVPGGLFATEIDPGQSAAVLALCAAAGLRGAGVVRDLAGLDRHVVARAPRE